MAYSVLQYCNMIADRVRTDTYAQALERSVEPGAVVVDIGTGTGLFALLACRLGAARVYAIEPNPAIRVAEEMARANGYADRIRFLKAVSTDVELPERADVVVSDLRGTLPLLGRHLPAVVDARRRFLAPGGTLIPLRDRLFVAPAESETLHDRYVGRLEAHHLGFDVAPLRRVLANSDQEGRPDETALLAAPACWATLDYATLESSDVVGQVSWTLGRPGTLHGFHLYFETDLADGISFSSAPDRPQMIYGSTFLPFEDPRRLQAGDRVDLRLQAVLAGDVYLWHWITTLGSHGGVGPPVARYDQSSLLATPLALPDLRRRAGDAVPGLGEHGQVLRMVLGRMADGARLVSIAREVAERFPHRFAGWEDAMVQVGAMAEKYGAEGGS